MKALATIFTTLFIVSSVLFFVFLEEDEVYKENVEKGQDFFSFFSADINKSENMNMEISEEFDDINISSISAKTIINKSLDENVYIRYDKKSNSDILEAFVKDDKLVIAEKRKWFFNIDFLYKDAPILEILLPEKDYKSVEIIQYSNTMRISELSCDSIRINSFSGNADIKTNAKNLYIKNTSGKTAVEKQGSFKVSSLEATVTSGTAEIIGFSPKNYFLKTTSGKLSVDDLSGSGEIKVTSGKINAVFKKWNGNLNSRLTSGSIDIELPKGSGVDIEINSTSGKVNYDLDGKKDELTKGEHSIGGSNKQNMLVNMTSGKLKLTNY